MQDLFKDIIAMDGVRTVLVLGFDGSVMFEHHAALPSSADKPPDWIQLVGALEGARESDVLFRDGRIYIRRCDIGYILIVASAGASVALLRLNCDIILPDLKPAKEARGFRRFFKK